MRRLSKKNVFEDCDRTLGKTIWHRCVNIGRAPLFVQETLRLRSGELYGEVERVPLDMDRVHTRMQAFRKHTTPDPTDTRSPQEIFYARPTECLGRLEEVGSSHGGDSTDQPRG